MTLVERVRYVVTANNAPAETTQAWQAGANYLPDDKRVFGDRIYVCAKANKGEKNPTQTVDEWVDMGAINPKRFEDEYVNTQTKSATALNLTLNIPSGFVNSFAFFNTDGRKITILDRNDAVIFEKELTVRDVVSNWWQYFFGGSFSYRNDVWRVGDTDYGGQNQNQDRAERKRRKPRASSDRQKGMSGQNAMGARSIKSRLLEKDNRRLGKYQNAKRQNRKIRIGQNHTT